MDITGMQLAAALVGSVAAIGVGMIGSKGVEAIGRNPGAFTNILIFGLLGMAFAEGLAILVFFVVDK
ncbi:MAG: ATP synthase F0 subunit C [Verrucomicrobiota bacterium]